MFRVFFVSAICLFSLSSFAEVVNDSSECSREKLYVVGSEYSSCVKVSSVLDVNGVAQCENDSEVVFSIDSDSSFCVNEAGIEEIENAFGQEASEAESGFQLVTHATRPRYNNSRRNYRTHRNYRHRRGHRYNNCRYDRYGRRYCYRPRPRYCWKQVRYDRYGYPYIVRRCR